MQFDAVSGQYVFRQAGHCPICDTSREFIAFSDKDLAEQWLPHLFRGSLRCDECKSLPRERALFSVLNRFYPHWRELVIHESSPSNSAASRTLRNECRDYVASQYDPALGFGNIHARRGYRSENLESQTFGDSSFDLVITQDVFEHVFEPAQAIQEIARTLRPGGAHIFTVPIVNGTRPSTRRARLVDGNIIHVLEPQYHGNPMSTEGSLVTIDWGYDIAAYLTKHSGLCFTVIFIDDLTRGIRAAYNEVLIARKLSAPDADL